MVNKNIVFMGSIYRGHVEPTKIIIKELLNYDYNITYYSLKKFEPILSNMDIKFIAYPEFDSLNNLVNQKLPINNVNDRITMLLSNTVAASLDLIKWGLSKLDNPSLIIYDNTSLWGHILSNLLKIHSICSSGVMLINQDSIMFSKEGQIYLDLPFNVSLPLDKLKEAYPSDVSSILDFISCQYSKNIITYTSPFFQRHSSYFPQNKYLFYADRCQDTDLITKNKPLDTINIFVSLGTVYNNNYEFFFDIIKGFMDYPYNVIISTGAMNEVFEQLISINISNNIKIVDFIEQEELLSNIDVFITHGGLNSVSEAICNLVPMLVVPQAGDQIFIAKQLGDLSAANIVQYGENFVERIHSSLNDILNNWENFQDNLIKIKKSFIKKEIKDNSVDRLLELIGQDNDICFVNE